jgi:hypothetical protein
MKARLPAPVWGLSNRVCRRLLRLRRILIYATACAFRFLRQPSRPKRAGIAPLHRRLQAAGAVSQT